jgi:hypothetical protein
MKKELEGRPTVFKQVWQKRYFFSLLLLVCVCAFLWFGTASPLCSGIAYPQKRSQLASPPKESPYDIAVLAGNSLQLKKAERALSFDWGYLKKNQNNQSIGNFFVEFFQGWSWVFDSINSLSLFEKNFSARGVLLLAQGFLTYWLSEAGIRGAYHEFGHARASRAFGGRPTFHEKKGDRGFGNVFSLFTKKIFKRHPAEALTTYYLPNLTPPSYMTKMDRNIILMASGVNNVMYFSSLLADEVYRHNGHILDAIPYFTGKMDAYRYNVSNEPSSDITALTSYYASKGFNIGRKDIRRADIISLALSGSTYAYILGIWDYVKQGRGKERVTPLEFWGIRLPEVSAYFGTRGISYHIQSAYRINPTLYIPFGYEFVFKGGRGHEFTVGVAKNFPSFYHLTVKGNVRLGSGIGGNASLSIPLTKRGCLSGGVSVLNARQLFGERHMTTFKEKPRVIRGWFRLSFVY